MEPPYSPPAGGSLTFNFDQPYTPPDPLELGFNFSESGGGHVGEDQYVFPAAIEAGEFGVSAGRLAFVAALPLGFSATAFGTHSAYLYARYINLAGRGVAASGYGRPTIKNTTLQAFPSGLLASAFGQATIYNLRKYLLAAGSETAQWGGAFVQGGVKYVTPNGIAAPAINKPTVINTTADQTAKPTGFNALSFGSPTLDPRSLRPFGIVATAYGTPYAQMPPRVAGFDALRFGALEIRDKTSYTVLSGIPAGEVGFPLVRDRASKLLHIASPVSAVFGDVSVRLTRLKLIARGFDTLEVSPWGSIIARNRYLQAAGFPSQQFGPNKIENATPSFAPAGFDAFKHGAAQISLRHRSLPLSGIPAPFPQVPSPVLTKTPSFAPTGFDASLIPGPMVAYRVRSVEAVGAIETTFGTSALTLKQRKLLHEGLGYKGDGYGAARVEHGIRLLIGQGYVAARYGTAHQASLRNRYVEPQGIERPEASSPLVGGTRFIETEGFEATRWGSRIIPEAQQLYPQGFGSLYGLATVYNLKQTVRPAGITTYPQPAQHWGIARAFNSDQYVIQHPIVGSGLEPPDWSQTWTAIINRDRSAAIQGFVTSRFGFTQIDNKARPVLPAGILPADHPAFYKAGLVAYRIRYLPLEGMEPPHISTWGRIYNKAFPLKPPGLVATEFGQSAVVNVTREFNRIGNFTTDAYGTPFIAYAIRSIQFDARYAIQPPRIELPYVGLYTNYVEPPGLEAARIGGASLSIFFRRITPRWTYITRIGTPAVRNLTPELGARGYNMEEYGDTQVRLQWRSINPQGTSMQVFGPTRIADRRQRVEVAGRNFLTVSDKLKVIKTGAPPLSTQRIWLYIPADDSVESGNDASTGTHYGIPPPGDHLYGQVPKPQLNMQFLYVKQEDESALFGTARITANSIRIERGYHNPFSVAEPRVELWRRQILCDTTTSAGGSAGLRPQEMAPVRVSPHTIYAVVEAPWQAVLNHPFRVLHYVDEVVSGSFRSWKKGVGKPAIGYRVRHIAPQGFAADTHGESAIENRDIVVTPPGVRGLWFGQAVIGGSQRTIYPTNAHKLDHDFGERFGESSILLARRYLAAKGAVASAVPGSHAIDYYHRYLRPTGINALAMGASGGGTPYMRQRLHVGPPDWPAMQGFNAEVFGETNVSNWIREISPDGFEETRMIDDQFPLRMRVTRGNVPVDLPWMVEVDGIAPQNRAGTPNVRPAVHFIRPDGNAEQFRKGAF
ncbi:MAG: hypothetical protein RBS10_01480 [Thauera propionica]|nr:hypothetical protein [Thauera propionica]